MDYRSFMKLIGIKSGKNNKPGQIFGGCTGTGHQRSTCTSTGPTCTGTGQQNATCTGTGPRCTGTGEPKMPRMLCFCLIKPEFVHQ